MKHNTQNSSLCSLHQKRKINNFLLKKPSATKHSPPSNLYCMAFYRNFLIEYSLIGIMKPKFTRRKEIWRRISEIEDLSKNVRKTQDRTSLIIQCHGHRNVDNIICKHLKELLKWSILRKGFFSLIVVLNVYLKWHLWFIDLVFSRIGSITTILQQRVEQDYCFNIKVNFEHPSKNSQF